MALCLKPAAPSHLAEHFADYERPGQARSASRNPLDSPESAVLPRVATGAAILGCVGAGGCFKVGRRRRGCRRQGIHGGQAFRFAAVTQQTRSAKFTAMRAADVAVAERKDADGVKTDVAKPDLVHDRMPDVLTQIRHTEDDTIVYSEESSFREWLRSRGCVGFENVDIVAGGDAGVWLRSGPGSAGVDSGLEMLRVPREAWISCSMEEEDPEAELAWRLLSERWLGPASNYAPYVNFLWQLDLSLHPIFWDEEECDWLQASVETHKALCELRDTIDARVSLLRKRAQSFSSPVPPHLAADRASLDAEIRFALCLVEARAIEANPTADGEFALAALVPLLDHLNHDGSGRECCEVGEREGDAEGPMCVVALRDIEPGEQLKHCFEPLSAAELFVRYGQVLHAASLDEAVKANVHHTVSLPMWVAAELYQSGSKTSIPLKQRLLAERVCLDTHTSKSACLTLPQDMSSLKGRMMPAARFLCAMADPELGEPEEMAVQRSFDKYFRGRLPGEDCLSKQWCPLAPDVLGLETVARAIAWEWCNKLIKRYEKVAKRIYADIGGTEAVDGPDDEEDGADDVDEEESLPPALEVDSIVNAHYKAKGPDGSRIKSRKPKEARVLAVDGDKVVVQFLANGVRHTVPRDWLMVESSTVQPAATPKEPPNRLKVARGTLALSLVQTEASVVQLAYNFTSDIVRAGDDVAKSRENKDRDKQVQAERELQRIWDEQHAKNYG